MIELTNTILLALLLGMILYVYYLIRRLRALVETVLELEDTLDQTGNHFPDAPKKHGTNIGDVIDLSDHAKAREWFKDVFGNFPEDDDAR